jgi:hypothetical protein
MKVQIVANIVPISAAITLNLLHHNNVGATYARTSNFKVEIIRLIPLYFVAMPHSTVIVIEIPFTIALAHTITSIRSIPQTPRGTNFVNMHTKMPREVDMIFVRQSLDLGGGGLRLLGPSRYFGLPMVNPSRPPLPLNRPYRRPLNYLEYVKDFDLDVHVRVFKVVIGANGETKDVV